MAAATMSSPATVREQLSKFRARTRADELIVATAIYDRAARLRSYELLAGSQMDVANVLV